MGFPILKRRRLYINSGPWSSSHTKHRRKKNDSIEEPKSMGEKAGAGGKIDGCPYISHRFCHITRLGVIRLQLVFISFDTIKRIWSVSIYWISITVEVRCKDKTYWFDWGLGWGYKTKFLSSVSFSPLSKYWLYCIHSTGLTVSKGVSI